MNEQDKRRKRGPEIVKIDRIKLITEMAKSETKVYELAAKAGLCRATIVAIRRGKSCRKQSAINLAAGLEVPLSNILLEKENIT